MPAIVGTHPIPQKYYAAHKELSSWAGMKGRTDLLATEEVRKAYD